MGDSAPQSLDAQRFQMEIEGRYKGLERLADVDVSAVVHCQDAYLDHRCYGGLFVRFTIR